MTKRTLLLTGLGIFLAGALAGGTGMALFAKTRLAPLARMDKLGPGGFIMERLDFALRLSPEQRQAIGPIVEETLEQVRAVRQPCTQAEDQAVQAGAQRVRSHLSPQQSEKLDKFLQNARERRARFFGGGGK